MSKIINIMLVDDHAVVRAGYRVLLKSAAEIKIVAEANSAEEAYHLYAVHRPDVVVMDLSLPGNSGIEGIRRLYQYDNTVKILVFSMHEDVIFVDQAIQAGAYGYITKNTVPELLIEAIRKVASGVRYINEKLTKSRYQKSGELSRAKQLADLSTREFEIFCLLAEGLSTNDISKQLSLNYKTVANYSTQIKTKLKVTTVADIARLAIRYNIIKA